MVKTLQFYGRKSYVQICINKYVRHTVIPATYYKYVDVIKAGSVEVRGLKLEQVPVRNKGQKNPNLEFYSFQPYISDKV